MMFKDMSELAENKLILLYIFCELDIPLSNSQITQIILENNLINYFSLQQYLSELKENEFISSTKRDNQHFLSITHMGKETLKFFKGRITAKKKLIIDEYLKSHFNTENRIESICDFEPANNDEFIINLKLVKGTETYMELKFPASSKEEAKNICSKWKENSTLIYSEIMNLFNKDSEKK